MILLALGKTSFLIFLGKAEAYTLGPRATLEGKHDFSQIEGNGVRKFRNNILWCITIDNFLV